MSNIITKNISDVPVKEKQVLFDVDNGDLYLDFNGERIEIGGGETYTGLVDATMQPTGDALTVEAMLGGFRYTVAAPISTLTVDEVQLSSLESELWVTFVAGDTAPTVTFPVILSWIGEPSFEAGKSYIINICNNVAICAEYTHGEA